MHAKDLLQLVAEDKLRVLAVETKVDHYAKKLDGLMMFQLILFSFLNRKRVSLRVMEEFLCSASFRHLSNRADIDAKYNSLSERISLIKAEYFEQIFYYVYDTFSKYLDEKSLIHRYDSTMVAVSSKLFNWGMRTGAKSKTDKKQLKFTMGMHGSLPSHLQLFSNQTELSENVALNEAITKDTKNINQVVVFDRGLTKKDSFEKYSDDSIRFVTRTFANIKYDLISKNKIGKKPKDSTVTLVEDLVIKLSHRSKKQDRNSYRMLKGTIDKTGEEIFFLSNMDTANAYEIAAIYKSRWQIEILFKFLKQELNIEHIISRNENGVKVMMYMTLITAILIIAFKKINQVSSFKIAKLRFALQMEELIIRQIVILTGGDTQRLNLIFNGT
jgi:hypothetical protein